MKYFKDILEVKYEGLQLDNLFVFKYYNFDEVIDGKFLKDYFCFVIVYWYMFCVIGSDFFG